MSITPSDVRDMSFRVVRRGYATQEVDTFLDRVEHELSRLTGQRQVDVSAHRDDDVAQHAAQEPVGPAEDTAGGAGQALTVLRLAEQTAQQLVSQARTEADSLLSAAREQATALVGEAREQQRQDVVELESRKGQLQSEVDGLEVLRRQHRANLVQLLEDQLRRVRQDEPLRIVGAGAVA